MGRKKLLIIVVVLTVFVFARCCGNDTDSKPEVSTQLAQERSEPAADAMLEVIGGGIDINLDAQQMLARPQKTFTCKNVSSSGEIAEVEVTGFSLDELLSENGLPMSDIMSINFVGDDGFVMAASADIFADTEVYIMLVKNGDVLAYPTSCIPDQRAMYWVRDLVRVELTITETALVAAKKSVDRISIFREAAGELTSDLLDNRGTKVASYSLRAYFEKFATKLPLVPVTLIAGDGFKKTETPAVFLRGFVTLESEPGSEDELPLYFSEEMNIGMRVKQLDAIIAEGEAIYLGREISVSKLFALVEMKEAPSYRFIAGDGYETEIPFAAIPFGKICFDDNNGYMRASFEGYDFTGVGGRGIVKYLTFIEAVDEDI